MRLAVEVDGRTTVVEVSDDLASVRIGERSYPVQVVAGRPTRVELVIGGESVVVDGWPEHQSEPPGPVDVNGERRPVTVRVEGGTGGGTSAAPTPALPAVAGPAAPVAAVRAPAGATDILPPMPGRIVEVRVHEGEVVAKGAVLLIVEAMKMRNEVTAPVDGIVRDLRAQEGMRVRTGETLLLIVPKN